MSIVRNIVGRLHVSASDRDVIRAVSRSIMRAYRFEPELSAERKRCYREALRCHAENRKLYRYVMSGGH